MSRIGKGEEMTPKERRYDVFDHTADLGVRIFGKSIKDLLENAGFAIYDLLTDLEKVNERDTIQLAIEGDGLADLMINWLREILYLWNGREKLIRSFEIQEIENNHIRARLKGETYDPDRHVIKMEIKAVTYHQAKVGRSRKGWWARIVFDV